MESNERGFTLVELVVVIVILGILAATAVPKFVSMKTEAANAAVQGVASAITSAFAINYSAYSANSNHTGVIRLSGAAEACSGVSALLVGGTPTGYSVNGTANCGTAGNTGACVVSDTVNNASASATMVCTG